MSLSSSASLHQPASTLLDVLTARAAAPFPIALGLGFTALSYFTWGNIGGIHYGVVPMVGRAEEREKVGLDEDPRKCVELWGWFMDHATPHLPASAAISTIALAAAAYLAPGSSSTHSIAPRSSIRTLIASAAGLSSLIIPYTIVRLLPINKILLNYRDQIVHNRKPKPQSASASSVSPGTVSILSASEDARMLTLLTRWQEMHRWRIIAGLGAWSLSLAAIVVSV